MPDAPDFGPASALQTQDRLATPAALPMSEVQLQIARERPRDEFMVAERVIKELTANADYAEDAFYSIPRKDTKKGVLNFVEGVSIRGAEHIWSRWGNCTVGSRVADERHDKIMVQGLFFDYESGLQNLEDGEVGKLSKGSSGSYPLGEDALRLAVAAGKQKVKRNAFLGAIPPWIKTKYLATAQSLVLLQPGVAKPKAPAERIADAKAYFVRTYKLKDADIADLLERIGDAYPGIDDPTLLRYLLGVKNALKFGDVTTKFIFGEDKQEMKPAQEKKAPAPATTTTTKETTNDGQNGKAGNAKGDPLPPGKVNAG